MAIAVAAVVGLPIGSACRARSNVTADALVIPTLAVATFLVLSSDRPLLFVSLTLAGAYTAMLALPATPNR